VVASVGADAVLAEGEEEGSETEEDLETEVVEVSEEAAASEAAVMTLDPREEVVATGAEVAAWATKAEDSTTTARLQAGLEVLPDLVVGLVDQVGMVLLGVGQATVPPAAAVGVVMVGMAETEDISNERAQEVTTIGTQNGHDTRFFCNCTPAGGCV